MTSVPMIKTVKPKKHAPKGEFDPNVKAQKKLKRESVETDASRPVKTETLSPKQAESDGKPVKNKNRKKHESKELKPKNKISASKLTGTMDGSAMKRKLKRINIKVEKRIKAETELPAKCLLLRGLPSTVNYTLIRDLAPKATRLELFKKGAMRHAFISFASHEDCKQAADSMKDFTLADNKIRVTYVQSQSRDNTKEPMSEENMPEDLERTFCLSNLPFSTTKTQLEEEFPNASKIVLSVNLHNRSRGSCMLKFSTVEDRQAAWKLCSNRLIGNRPVKRHEKITFRVHQSSIAEAKLQAICGVRLPGLPMHVDESALQSIFTKGKLPQVRMSVDVSSSTKTALLTFADRGSQKMAIEHFRKTPMFGLKLRPAPWNPRANAVKPKLIYSKKLRQSNKEDTETGISSKSHKHKHAHVEAEESVMDDSALLETTENGGKKKHKKHGKHDTENSLDQSELHDESTLGETKREKKHKKHGKHVTENDLSHSELQAELPTSETKREKKKDRKRHRHTSESEGNQTLELSTVDSQDIASPKEKRKKRKHSVSNDE